MAQEQRREARQIQAQPAGGTKEGWQRLQEDVRRAAGGLQEGEGCQGHYWLKVKVLNYIKEIDLGVL